jgi:PIN domain nuclease of toxin-antitoxin system
MKRQFVIDTNTLIFYFYNVFGQPSNFSTSTYHILTQAFSGSTDILLSIPSIVFVEIFDKWILTEEFAAKFHYEVYELINQCENIEIRSIDPEVIQHLMTLDGSMIGHDLHDKIVLASAMVLNCPLITTDTKVAAYVKNSGIIPAVLI